MFLLWLGTFRGVGAWLRISAHHVVMSRSGVATDEVSETESVPVREISLPDSQLGFVNLSEIQGETRDL